MKKLIGIILLTIVVNFAFAQTATDLSFEDVKTTTNSTASQIISMTIDPGTSGYFTLQIVCQRVSDGATKTWQLRVGFKKIGNSDPNIYTELLGTVLGSSGDKLILLSAIETLTTTADNININVKGLASTNVIWFAKVSGKKLIN